MEEKRTDEDRGIVDNGITDELDSITDLAGILTGAPVSFLFKINKGNTAIVSCIGLDDSKSIEEIGLMELVSHFSEEVHVVNDCKKDPELSQISFPEMYFYAGVPLKTSSGEIWGMLCVIDFEPRELDEKKIKALKLLATQTTKLFEIEQSNSELAITKEKLKSESDRLNNILEATQLGAWEWDMEKNIVSINHRFASMIGYELEELSPFTMDDWYKILHPEDRGNSDSVLKACFNRELDFYDIECRLIHKDGHEVWVNDKGRVTKWSPTGKPLQMSGTHADITNRKINEIQFQTVSDNIPGVVYRYKKLPSGKNRFEWVSNGANQIFGFSPNQVMENSNLVWDSVFQEDVKSLSESIDKSAESLTYWLKEYRYLHSDGSLRWHKGAGTPHKLEDGSIVWDSIIMDVTKRKKIEEKLGETLFFLQNKIKEQECIFNISRLDYSWDQIDSLFQNASNIFPLAWPIPEETHAKITFQDKVYLSSGYQPSKYILKSEYILHDGKSLELELVLPKNTFGENRSSNIKNESRLIDNLMYHLGTYLDQLSSQEALRISNERIGTLIQTIPGVFWESHSDSFKLSYISPQVKDILGYMPEEWCEDSEFWVNHIYSDDKEKVLKIISENSKTNNDFTIEYRFIKNNGSIVWVSDMIKVIVDEKNGIMYRGLMVDITKRKEAEIALKKNEKRFKALVENGRDAIVIFDAEGVQKYVSPSITQVLGYSEEEAYGLQLNETIHPEDMALSLAKIQRAMASPGLPIEGGIIRTKHKDGTWRWVESTITNFLDDPDINGLVDNFRDITEKVKLNNQMEKREKRFRSLVKEGSDLTAIISRTGEYLYVSPNYPQILGYKEEELIGDYPVNYFHPEDRDRVIKEFSNLPLRQRTKGHPYRYKRKDGSYCWLLTVATDLSDDPSLGGVVVNSMDISKLIEAQGKLITSESRYKSFLDSQTTFVIRIDLEGYISFANTKYIETFNWLFSDNEKINVINTVPDEEKIKLKQIINKCIQEPEKAHKVELHKLNPKKGTYTTIWDFVGILGVDGKPQEIQCNGIDISERIAFEEELKKSNERFELVMQTDSGSIWDFDPSTGDMFLGEGFALNFGIKIQSLSNNYEVFSNSIHPDDLDSYREKVRQIIFNSLENQLETAYRLIKENGEWAYVKEKAVILRDQNGKAYRVVGAIRDITLEHFYGELETIEKELMEMSMEKDAKLPDLLISFLSNLERLFPSMKMAILKVSDNRLLNLATPSFLDLNKVSVKDFELYLNELTSQENFSDLLNKEVFIPEIRKDNRWKGLMNFSKEEKIRSCWLLPIKNSSERLDAVLINFFEYARKPSGYEYYAIRRSQRIFPVLLMKFEYFENLHKSNERFTYVNMVTNDAIFDWDFNKDEFHWGEGFYRIFGYQKGEEINKISEWASFMHPVDSIETDKVWDDFVSDSKSNRWHKEYRFRHKSGQFLHTEEISYMIRDSQGKPLRMIGVLRDKTDEKENFFQKEVQQQIAEYFKDDSALKVILKVVLKYISSISDFSGCEIWLLNRKEVGINLLQDYWAIKNPNLNDIKKIDKGLANHALNSGSFLKFNELEMEPSFAGINSDIHQFIKEVIGIPLFQNNIQVGVLLLYVNDIVTLPKDCQQFFEPIGVLLGGEIKRKQQEEEMRLLFESAPEVLTVIDTSGYFVKVNPSFCKVFGYREEEVLNKKFEDFIHPEDKSLSMRKFSLEKGGGVKNLINRYQTKSGQHRWISWNTSDKFGEEDLVFIFGHDITELVSLQTLLDNASKLSRMGSWEIDLVNNEFFLSSTSKEIYGLPQDSSPSLEEISAFYDINTKDTIENALKQAVSKGKSWDYQILLKHLNGSETWIRSIGKPEFSNGKCVRISGSLQDIHNQKISEIELAKNNQLLEIISRVIEKFLLVEDWKDAIEKVFQLTSEAVEIDKINYFQKNEVGDDGEEYVTKMIEWTVGEDINFTENVAVQKLAVDDFPEIMDVLKRGELFIVNTSELPHCKLKENFEKLGVYSNVSIPITIKNKFYGFLSFKTCHTERNWSESEISFLQTISSNLSSAIQRTNSQKALLQSFKEKNAILESIGEAFFALDNDFKILYWNQRSEEIIGISKERALNNVIWEVIPRIKNSKVQKQLFFALQNQVNVHFEMFSDRRKIWLNVNGYPSEDGISVFIKDITQEKLISEKIQLSNERFEKIAEATNDAIWDYDIENNEVFRGVGFHTLFGYDLKDSSPDIVALQELIHPEDRERITVKFKEFINSDVLTNWFEEYRLLCKEGHYAFVIDRAIFIRNKSNKVTRVVGAITDITYRKEYEESLQAMNDQMAQHAIELERSNKELEQFAYVASHDLQEPLRMVSNFMGLLERKYRDELDEKAHQYIGFAVDGAMRMRQIILDLLEFSRIGKHEDKLKILNINELVDEVCVLQKKRIKESKAIVNFNKLPRIVSYKTPLFQVFYNLIGNALKYKNENEEPVIDISFEEKDGFWQFSVEDNGIGIDPIHHERIFTIFKRLHGKGKYEGTGMGLAIVKKIIDNLGGEVWVNSVKGEGAKFYFTIPKANPEMNME
ncbi:PAS domain-containing protein [Cyclobacterium marinum]|uniref:PAS domain-containing protein n=1 Tax=Cyclobacterium marinum TaxID=104 RepID=UPI0011EDC35D|nr:PAS domain-containing protein [Cyclobacterium marinum]MBI0398269.1 PAS domain-containing protein [Cyclobacterium marinum]